MTISLFLLLLNYLRHQCIKYFQTLIMCGTSLSAENIAYILLLLNEKKWNVADISRKLKISCSSVYRYKKAGLSKYEKKRKEQMNKGGRPREFDERDTRNLVRCLKSLRVHEGTFTAKRLAKEAGIDSKHVSMRTIRRSMNRAGYWYLQAR